MGGEHGLYHQVTEELANSVLAVARSDLCHRFSQRFRERLCASIALAQRARPVPVFGEIDQLEVARERPGHLLFPIDRPGRHQESGGPIVHIAVARGDDRAPELFNGCEQRRAAVLSEHFPKEVAEQAHLPAKCCRHLNARDFSRTHVSRLFSGQGASLVGRLTPRGCAYSFLASAGCFGSSPRNDLRNPTIDLPSASPMPGSLPTPKRIRTITTTATAQNGGSPKSIVFPRTIT